MKQARRVYISSFLFVKNTLHACTNATRLEADRKANLAAYSGRVMAKPSRITAASIRLVSAPASDKNSEPTRQEST